MIKWPEKLRNGREAGKLPGIGPSISAKLDEKLRQAQAESGYIHEIPEGALILPDDFDEKEVAETIKKNSSKKQKKSADSPKEYVPTFRSAPYSVLLALLLHLHQDPQNGPLIKSELVMKAQGFCTSPLTDGAFPTINSALKILEEKELIGRLGNPPQFLLSAKGYALAEKLWSKGEKRASQPPLPAFVSPERLFSYQNGSRPVKNTMISSRDSESNLFTWPAGSFEIVLLIDVREIRSREDRNYLSERLGQLGIPSEVRNLELGDFIWIARRKRKVLLHNDNEGKYDENMAEELILDTLIERKREDDLLASICDGRFREQKHRISRSLLASTFYLVERGGSAATHEFLGGTEERLQAATLQCQLIDGLMYRQTSSLDESIVFLAALHRHLCRKLVDKPIRGWALKACDFNYTTFPTRFKKLDGSVYMNYTAYSLLNSKSINQSASDIFLRQLLTVKGVTFEKACLILARYPDPKALHDFYRGLPNDLCRQEAFKDFAEEAASGAKRKFGAALSKKIYEVFGKI